VIKHGQLLAVGSPADLRARTSTPRLYVTGQEITSQVVDRLRSNLLVKKLQQRNGELILDLNDLTRSYEIVAQLAETGVKIDEVRKEKVDLEDVFLQLVEEEKRGEE
jgi:ABC-type multidrug transport system ATPase subunit